MTTPRQTVQHNYDRLARWYDIFTGIENEFTKAGLTLLDVKPGERTLEIGFGTGRTMVELAHRVGPSGLAAGVDISAGMAEIAWKRWQAEGPGGCAKLVIGDAFSLPFLRSTFDAVFLSFTLEIFEAIPVVLGECLRVLIPNGRIGVVALAKRNTLACRLYQWGHYRWPEVLDCRPIDASSFLEAGGFQVQASGVRSMWGLPVEIVVAAKSWR